MNVFPVFAGESLPAESRGAESGSAKFVPSKDRGAVCTDEDLRRMPPASARLQPGRALVLLVVRFMPENTKSAIDLFVYQRGLQAQVHVQSSQGQYFIVRARG
ncbi:Hypothetical protein DEACI_0397 [Acididesulfobacillus acetoxydans]|uniref:Uncharacterized protein n=1 Tax=Acididesulfobacillus acetoxydans TaxID=1561005 RepID=A0A8S0X348_9FIRM|nr:Hypothetical protein DEACI_0397 [Acididesulfobacillus acetoxydans]CEJ07336.1 Hypothetical protein DEACI_1799 [Acididesulfobacillus acetoxydans]